jgi:hypothetical protein
MVFREEIAAIRDMIDKGHTGSKYAIPLHWMTWMLKRVYVEEEDEESKGSRQRWKRSSDPKTKKSAIDKQQYVQLISEV